LLKLFVYYFDIISILLQCHCFISFTSDNECEQKLVVFGRISGADYHSLLSIINLDGTLDLAGALNRLHEVEEVLNDFNFSKF
jgi:hypothetical protein